MPQYSYSFERYEKSRHVRAAIRDKSISHKHSREIAVAINNKSIEKAREFLEDVLAKKIAVLFRRYNNEVDSQNPILETDLALEDIHPNPQLSF